MIMLIRGAIILFGVFVVSLCSPVDSSIPHSLRVRPRRSLAHMHVKRWTNATIPYKITNGGKSDAEDFSAVDIELIEKAISTIEQESCVRFKDVTNQTLRRNFTFLDIVGTNEQNCYSPLGMTDVGRNELILNPLCRSFGQIVHELAHALGLMHELMRPDRDDYITVHERNILPNYKAEFQKITPVSGQLWDRIFDFQSITLYDPFSFTANSRPVWEPKVSLENTPLFPLREKDLSFEDVAAINRLYKCSAHCSKRRRECRPNEFQTKSCRCETPASYAYRRCHDDRAHWKYCSDAVEKNKCYDHSRKSIPFCRKTCGRCFRSGMFGRTKAPMKVCLDLEPQTCPQLIKEGYCYFDAWTKINCQLSCGLCPPLRIAKQQTYTLDARAYLQAYQEGNCFNRYDDLKCLIYAERGDCERNPGFMSSFCALSCGNCGNRTAADLSYLHPKSEPCKNHIEDERCDALAREGKCQGTTLKQCRVSCKQCIPIKLSTTTPVTTTTKPSTEKANSFSNSNAIECKDKSTICIWFVQNGRCKDNDTRIKNLCPKSCGICEPECLDLDSTAVCNHVVSLGYCKHGSHYAARCKLSCGLCEKGKTVAKKEDKVQKSQPVGVRKMGSLVPPYREELPRTRSSWQAQSDRSDRRSQSGRRRATTAPFNLAQIRRQMVRVDKHRVEASNKVCIDVQPEHICLSWSWSGYCDYSHVARLCRHTCGLCATVARRLWRRSYYYP